ncbi:MAG TPA: Rieske (2Fe-2S) protein [Acidimicrobiia bacterium]|nr:Rieske (2Fe-2S) protein [Acidimicrobiia bacterium]
MDAMSSVALAPGRVIAVELDGDEFVVWRGHDGRLRSAPRRCPHLDHDLVEGYVIDCELVCAGHAWEFDGEGNVFKRNEFGRVDPKGTVETLMIEERDGRVEVARR